MRRSLTAALGMGSLFLLAACQDDSPTLGPAVDPGAPVAASKAAQPLPGQYIVVFRPDVADVRGEAGRLAAKHGGRLTHVYTSALKGMALRLPDAAVAALRANPTVAYVEQDQVVHAIATETNATWGLDRVDQRALPLSTTYVYNADGTGVKVYIIDTGIRLDHADFGTRAQTGFDAVTSGGRAADCNGHGTHVAGTVGGATYGIAKNAGLYAVRVLDCGGSGSWSQVIAGIDWVTANHGSATAVANMSLGGGKSDAVNTAVENSIASGVVYAVAAGNGNIFGIPQDACNNSPASAPSALTTGATTKTDGSASFSNYGTCVDILAPGVDVTSDWYTSTTATNTISGTSMATPHVAGAAAAYLSTNPSSTPAQVATALTGNATLNAISGVSNGTPNRLLYTGFIGGGSPPPSSVAVHFAGLSGAKTAQAKRNWQATATVTVRDAGGNPVSGATATLGLSGGASGSVSCTTGTSGQCARSVTVKNQVTSVAFTAQGIQGSGMTYDAAANVGSNPVTVTR
ncbi:MAG: S8 family serine peptidase [Gemmatimonadales bacterium]